MLWPPARSQPSQSNLDVALSTSSSLRTPDGWVDDEVEDDPSDILFVGMVVPEA